jgi:glucosamine--fructose-6-phosphate aminotransferase (isomerizing)
MCGISGVYGFHAPWKATLITLGQLERGTQGSGVAYTCSNRLEVIKEPIHPVAFLDMYYSRLLARSMVAIGHNRQPSIGKVCYVNTHPFMACDGSFALVHNGHTVNGDLAKQLKSEGHRIQGETDSEVLCHLVEKLYHVHGNMANALYVLDEYEFSGAILVLMRDGRIFGFKDDFYPLWVGRSRSEVYLASTQKAIESLVGRAVNCTEVKPWQIVVVSRGKVIWFKPKKVERPEVKLPWYSSFFYDNLRGGDYI